MSTNYTILMVRKNGEISQYRYDRGSDGADLYGRPAVFSSLEDAKARIKEVSERTLDTVKLAMVESSENLRCDQITFVGFEDGV